MSGSVLRLRPVSAILVAMDRDRLTIEVQPPDQRLLDDDGAWYFLYEVHVRDRAHPGVLAVFGIAQGGSIGRPTWISLSIEPVDGRAQLVLTSTGIRDLPLSSWSEAARAVLRSQDGLGLTLTGAGTLAATGTADTAGTARAGNPTETLDLAGQPLTAALEAHLVVDERFPGLRDDETPGGRRRYRSVIKLATVAAHYRRALASGRGDAAAAVAEELDANPATARSWVHRARKAGFLGEAPTNSPGERP